MKLDFDLEHVSTIEFGVGRDANDEQNFVLIAVDGDVQDALREMAVNTKDAMAKLTAEPAKYDPSEKHASSEYVFLPLTDDLAERMRELHQATNLPMDTTALSDPSDVFCYVARMTDTAGRRLTSLHRAGQFKGVLKSRLLYFGSDALKIIQDKVFKLDVDFDLLVDSGNVHILRPGSFEFAGRLQQALLDAVPANIKSVQHDLKFVNFEGIQEYAVTHPRAARYIASIRGEKETKNIDKAALKKLCKANGVEIKEFKGRITVQEAHVMDFLEVLDRRRYELELVPGSPERFRATSRQKLPG